MYSLQTEGLKTLTPFSQAAEIVIVRVTSTIVPVLAMVIMAL